MKALFQCKNLLGDSLQATPAIAAFCEKHKPEVVDVQTNRDYISIIFERMGYNVHALQIPDEEINEDNYDFVFNFDISKAWRIGILNNLPACQAFAIMLGFEIKPVVPIFKPNDEAFKWIDNDIKPNGGYVLFQPYSVSCSSWTNEPANKRWQDEKWAELYKRVTKELGVAVRVLGGLQDKKNYFIPGIDPLDHWFGLDLDKVAALQYNAILVVTLDSGVAHLAASQNANMLEFYPECLPSNWMSNLANPNGRIIHAVPSSLSVDFVWPYVKSDIVTTLGNAGLQTCQQE